MSYFWRIHKAKLDELIKHLNTQKAYFGELAGEDKELVTAKYETISRLVNESGLLKSVDNTEPKKLGRPKNAKVAM